MSSCSKRSTVEVTEMPRRRSSSIQSDVAAFCPRRAVTEPASPTAPAYSSSFSVSVVLPASGCEMMANVRRRAASCTTSPLSTTLQGTSATCERRRTSSCSPRSRSRSAHRRRPDGPSARSPGPASRIPGRRRSATSGTCVVREAISWARIEIAMSAGVRAPMSSPAGVWTRERSASVQRVEHRGAALGRGHQRDVVDAGVQRGRERLLLALAVGGDDQRGVAGLRLAAPTS